MKEIGIGIIGAGGMAANHMTGIQKATGVKIVAICDVNLEAARAMAARFDIPYVFNNHHALLDCLAVEAVTVATPNYLHYPVAMDVIAKAKPYLLEKPIAFSKKEAKEILDATVAKGLPNMVGFTYRFCPALRYAKYIVDQGILGTIHHVYSQYVQGLERDVPRHWRYVKELAGTGTLGDLGSHVLDMTRFIVGDIQSVSAQDGIIIDKRKDPQTGALLPVTTDDYCHILAKIEGDVSAMFAFTKFAYARANFQRFEVYGSQGGLIYNLEEGTDYLEVCIGEVYKKAHQYVRVNIPKEFYMETMQAFSNVLHGLDRSLAGDIVDGYHSQCVLDAIVASCENGLWEEV